MIINIIIIIIDNGPRKPPMLCKRLMSKVCAVNKLLILNFRSRPRPLQEMISKKILQHFTCHRGYELKETLLGLHYFADLANAAIEKSLNWGFAVMTVQSTYGVHYANARD